ncbi:MAG TPA: CapA family protein, partial [Allocoleopsis sp.]
PLTLQQVLPESSLASPTAGTLAEGETPPNLPLPEQGAIGSGDFDATSEAEGFDPTELNTSEFDPTETDAQQAENAQKTTIQELLANGVDIVNVAATDQQAKTPELVQTLDVLKRSNIFSLGAGQEAKASRRPQVFDVKGQRVAYLGYSDPSLATKLAIAAGLAPDMTSQMVADLEAIRSQVDWVIVSFRWQRNLRAYPEDWQVKLAHQAIDHGADLVVGYHPHLTQGAEIYQGRAIVYSLGQSMEEYDQAYSDYGYEEETRPEQDTVSLKLTLEEKTMKLEFLPVQIRQGKVTLAEGETAEKILSAMQQASSFLERPMQSPTVLDARLRVSLPSAPDTHEIQTEPFLAEPESAQ